LLHNLQERIKELTALHGTARLLQHHSKPDAELLTEVLTLLPPAWQYPEITGARIWFRDLSIATPGFQITPWMQTAQFNAGSEQGGIEISYTEYRPDSAEGPFLKEERDLINSLAEMLRSHFQHRLADEALLVAHSSLEKQVKERTIQLEDANRVLSAQVWELQEANRRIEEFQRLQQRLTLELSLAEVRERREIASDLHDHIGQALAYIKMQISQFQSNAVFCGFESNIAEIMSLLDGTIAYTRSLTVQISPPVLHEFGLAAAIEWLGDQFRQEHKLNVTVDRSRFAGTAKGEHAAVLFRSVKELLTNAGRHSGASKVTITVSGAENLIHIMIADNGRGFDYKAWQETVASSTKYGLFSVRERIRLLGGEMSIDTSPGQGTTIHLEAPLTANR
jgi:signal transduction histidine kinase